MFKFTEDLIKAYEDLFIYAYNNCRSEILSTSDIVIVLDMYAKEKYDALMDIALKESKTHVDIECVKKAILRIKRDMKDNFFPDKTCAFIRQQIEVLKQAVYNVLEKNSWEQIEKAFLTKNAFHILCCNSEVNKMLKDFASKSIIHPYRLHIDESIYGVLVAIYAYWEGKKNDSNSN